MEAEKVSGIHGCCPNPLLILLEPQNQQPLPKPKSTTAACRHTFAATTTSSFFPNTHFTNHESLPSYQESFAQFLKAYPKYSDEREHDRDRHDKEHRYREERDGYRDYRQKERESEYEEDYDRGQSSSRSRSKSRAAQEENHRSRSRDTNYGKRRRGPSE